MADSNPNSTPFQCGDSPLSVTGNVIGVLTFIVSILLSARVYYSAVRGSVRNLRRVHMDFQQQRSEFERLESKLARRIKSMDDTNSNKKDIERTIQKAKKDLGAAEKGFYKWDENLTNGLSRWIARVRYLWNEAALRECVERIGYTMATLKDIAADINSDEGYVSLPRVEDRRH